MMKKILFACLAVLLTANTCLGNPVQDSFTDESLMTTSSRLIQNHIQAAQNQDLLPARHCAITARSLSELTGRKLIEAYRSEDTEQISRFTELYRSLPASLRPALNPAITSLMEYLFSAEGQMGTDFIRRTFPEFSAHVDKDIRAEAALERDFLVEHTLVPASVDLAKSEEAGVDDLIELAIEWGLFAYDSDECQAEGHQHENCPCSFTLATTQLWEVVEAGRKFTMGRLVVVSGTMTGTTFTPAAVHFNRVLAAYGQNTFPQETRTDPTQDFKVRRYIFTHDLQGTLCAASSHTLLYLTGQELTRELNVESARVQAKAAEEATYWYTEFVPGGIWF